MHELWTYDGTAVRKLTLFHDYMLLAMSGFQIKSNPKKSLESSLF